MRLCSIVLIALCSILTTVRGAGAACVFKSATIEGTTDEIVEACKALVDVANYFARIGFKLDPATTIVFADKVVIPTVDAVTRAPGSEAEVSGYFDSSRDRVEVMRRTSRSRPERHPWNLEWGPDIANSILRHEISHAATRQVMGKRYDRMSKEWIEFMAYVVQFELMNEDLKSRVLTSYASVGQISRPEEVNVFLLSYDPDGFAVMAYKYAEANGGREFVRRLLSGRVPFDTEEMEWLQ